MTPDDIAFALRDIRDRVQQAVSATGVGLKPFATRNGMGETVVRDLLKAHNKDIQIVTLLKIAEGAGVDIASLMPGQPRSISQQALERAISEALPGLPRATDRRAQYLAATVARILQLPEGLRDEPANDATPAADDSDAAAPPRSPTS